MHWIQKLGRNGNSTTLVFPRPMLQHLGWIPTDVLVITQHDDGTVTLEKWEPPKRARVPRGGLEASTAAPVLP